jgi:hypothetical protein
VVIGSHSALRDDVVGNMETRLKTIKSTGFPFFILIRYRFYWFLKIK